MKDKMKTMGGYQYFPADPDKIKLDCGICVDNPQLKPVKKYDMKTTKAGETKFTW